MQNSGKLLNDRGQSISSCMLVALLSQIKSVFCMEKFRFHRIRSGKSLYSFASVQAHDFSHGPDVNAEQGELRH